MKKPCRINSGKAFSINIELVQNCKLAPIVAVTPQLDRKAAGFLLLASIGTRSMSGKRD